RAVPPLGLILLVAGVGALVAASDGGDRLVAWILTEQRQFHRALAAQLHALAGSGSLAAGWGLIGVSFLYGLFHAAGPGHGKAVIATYLLTQACHLRRGLALAAGGALLQGLTAILLVSGLGLLAGGLPGGSALAVSWSERASFALLAGLGLLFAVRAGRGLLVGRHARHDHHDHHDHDHHDHHGHVHGPGCGCVPAPGPDQIARAESWRGVVGVLLSIGLRPCSGAVLVLALANLLGLGWAGIAAVAAMSCGTALAVAVLAVASVRARGWVGRWSGGDGGTGRLGQTVALLGGGGLFLLGVSLLLASFGPAHPLRF
ncbi:MAG: hypothetical protein RLZZ501_1223, partial [Pseudomonadota bacterium]